MNGQEYICQWCNSTDTTIRKAQVAVLNAQIDAPHTLLVCNQCGNLSLSVWWGSRLSLYRAIEKRRFLRPSLCIIVYPVICAWCGQSNQMQPEEINATIANPTSRRHRYDIYGCYACDNYTAFSPMDTIKTYRARPDPTYQSLYYLEEGGDDQIAIDR